MVITLFGSTLRGLPNILGWRYAITSQVLSLGRHAIAEAAPIIPLPLLYFLHSAPHSLSDFSTRLIGTTSRTASQYSPCEGLRSDTTMPVFVLSQSNWATLSSTSDASSRRLPFSTARPLSYYLTSRAGSTP